jgi:hypothetical protein
MNGRGADKNIFFILNRTLFPAAKIDINIQAVNDWGEGFTAHTVQSFPMRRIS